MSTTSSLCSSSNIKVTIGILGLLLMSANYAVAHGKASIESLNSKKVINHNFSLNL